MKLRQKLAAVLAATLVATSIPVVTMAASDNALTNGIMIAKDETTVNAGSLKVEMKDVTDDTTGAMFFVNVANAEWQVTDTVAPIVSGDINYTYKVNSKNELQVTVKANAGSAKGTMLLPLNVLLKGGDATVAVDGAGTVISNMAPVVFAKTSESKANVYAADPEYIYESGAVADIKVEEDIKGSISSGTAEERTVKLTLKNSDYEFSGTTADIQNAIVLSKGFTADKIVKGDITVNYGNSNTDKQVIEVTLPVVAGLSAPGRIEFKGLEVKAKNPKLGDINVQVDGTNVNKTTVKVAEVKTFGNVIEMKDKKVVDIVAGQQDEVTFSLKEIVNDSFIAGRTVDVKLDKGYFTNTNKDNQTLVPVVKLNDTALTAAQVTAMKITPITNDDDYVTGFTFTMPALDIADTDELTFEDMPVFVPLTTSGEVKISAEGRALAETASVAAVNAKAPIAVTTEAMTLKVGLKEQKGGKITIKETDKEMLAAKNLEIVLPTEAGLTFSTTKPVVKVVAGDLQLGDIKIQNNKLIVAIKRASNTASTIEISDLVVSTDRTLPQGSYDIKVQGDALIKTADAFLDEQVTPAVSNDDKNTFEVKNFFVIGTPNTEDITSNGLTKGISSFAIGDKNFTINGVKQAMDAAPYVNNGRTMVPVRYVANALGVKATDIYFANGTVTVIAGSKTISLQVGSKVAKLNGVPARVMETAPVIKEGRVYIPVSEIGALLGVNASWDNATKVATFENK